MEVESRKPKTQPPQTTKHKAQRLQTKPSNRVKNKTHFLLLAEPDISTMAVSSSNTATRARSLRRQSIISHAAFFLWGCCCTTLVLNVFHGTVMHSETMLSVEHFADKHIHSLKSPGSGSAAAIGGGGGAAAAAAVSSSKKTKIKTAHHANSENVPSIAGLKCDKYGGPSEEASQEMVYWRDITSDNAYESPFHTHDTIRYLTFEPDGGGWNNIRMAMVRYLCVAPVYLTKKRKRRRCLSL
jgi:hypothetical protein